MFETVFSKSMFVRVFKVGVRNKFFVILFLYNFCSFYLSRSCGILGFREIMGWVYF